MPQSEKRRQFAHDFVRHQNAAENELDDAAVHAESALPDELVCAFRYMLRTAPES